MSPRASPRRSTPQRPSRTTHFIASEDDRDDQEYESEAGSDDWHRPEEEEQANVVPTEEEAAHRNQVIEALNEIVATQGVDPSAVAVCDHLAARLGITPR